MPRERPFSLPEKKPFEVFGFTDQEVSHWRLSDTRFREIIADPQTLIHAASIDENDYGEFLFVTTSRKGSLNRVFMTFYGLGYQEHRQRWVTDQWFWYQPNTDPELLQKRLTRDEAEELFKQRLEKIAPYVAKDKQTQEGVIFEMLADLTDDDAARADIEDLSDLPEWLRDDDDV